MSITGVSTYKSGEELELKCTSDGGPDLEYNWSRSGTSEFEFPNDTVTNTSVLIVSNLSTDDGGLYTCNVTNDAGSSECSITIYGLLFTVHLNAQ